MKRLLNILQVAGVILFVAILLGLACILSFSLAWLTVKALEAGVVNDSVKLQEAILDQQPSSFFKEYGVKVWEDV